MKKVQLLLSKCLVLVGVMIFVLSASAYAAEPKLFDGSDNKLGTDETVYFFANGTPITIEESTKGEGALIKWDGGEQEVPANTKVFGGAHDDSTEMTTSITMKGGKVFAIYGGGLHKSNVKKATIKIEGGTIENAVMGGGASSLTKLCGCENAVWYNGDAKASPCVVEEANVTIEKGAEIKGTTYSLLYGGGEGISRTDATNLIINGGKFENTYVTAGGSNGYTGKANLTINDGDFGTVLQGINRGTIDEIKMKILGGTFENVYIGGETDDKGVTGEYGMAEIEIAGKNTVIKKLLPGSNGASQTDDATKISGKISKDVKITNIENVDKMKEIFGENIELKNEEDEGGGTVWQNPYKDVKESQWFYVAVKYVTQKKLFNGTTSKTFEPDTAMTRGMMAMVLYRMSGEEVNELSTFEDVDKNAYYAQAVAWAQGKGIVNGIGDNKFAPEEIITREQIVTMMYRYANTKEQTIQEEYDMSSYKDSEKISEYAISAFKWACQNNIIDGVDDTTLAPQESAKRAEVAKILMNYMKM